LTGRTWKNGGEEEKKKGKKNSGRMKINELFILRAKAGLTIKHVDKSGLKRRKRERERERERDLIECAHVSSLRKTFLRDFQSRKDISRG